jgi:hypothetical protein
MDAELGDLHVQDAGAGGLARAARAASTVLSGFSEVRSGRRVRRIGEIIGIASVRAAYG